MNMSPDVVLILEDNDSIAKLMQVTLFKVGFRGEIVADRAELFHAMEHKKAVAIVLDLGLPGDDGFAILRQVRLNSNIPVIIVTGRADVRDRVYGLHTGADDYLVKPFSPEELAARIMAVLRRKDNQDTRQKPASTIRMGEVTLDLRNRELRGPKGATPLRERESGIVFALAKCGTYMSRQAIYPEVFGRVWTPRDHSLEVHVHHLRKKFSAVSDMPTPLEANRSIGYRLTVPCEIEYEH